MLERFCLCWIKAPLGPFVPLKGYVMKDKGDDSGPGGNGRRPGKTALTVRGRLPEYTRRLRHILPDSGGHKVATAAPGLPHS